MQSRITTFQKPGLILDAEFSEACANATRDPRNPQNPQNLDPEPPAIDRSGSFAGFEGFAGRLPFPVDAFPGWLAGYVRAVAEARQVPEAMAGAACLGIASAACGGGLRISNHLGELPANLFVIVAAETGTGKDLTLAPIAAPLRDIEAELEAEFFEQTAPRLQARREEIQRALKPRSDKPDPDRHESERLFSELAEIERQLRARPQLIVNDCTAQALAEVMAGQPGEAVASITSEGRGPLAIVAGKFSDSGDQEFFAGAFSGTPRTVNRKGRGPVSECFRLNRPCLTLLWLLQPDAYRAALAEPENLESGFLCRPLSFDSHAEPPIFGEEVPTIPEGLADAWAGRIRELAETYRANGADPRRVHLDTEAARILREFSNETSRARSSQGPLRDVAGVAARWAENAYRVALVLHAAEHGGQAHERTISAETARAAVALVRWFAAETLAMLAETRASKRQAREARLVEILTRKGGQETIRNLRDTHGFSEAELAEIAETSGRLSIVEITHETGGRPSTVVRLINSKP